jgi:hypothetical protein
MTDKIYYHGTETRRAQAIMSQGFKLGEIMHGRLLGRGLYITQRLESARFWAHDIVFRCRLAAGTRILWIHEEYDRKVLRALQQEFGRELLSSGPHFQRAIPANKHLTNSELITLCNYLFAQRRKTRDKFTWPRKEKRVQAYYALWEDLSALHAQARRQGYDALGNRTFADWDSDEILVFNPSRVTPLTAHRLFWEETEDYQDIVTISDPLDMDTLAQLSQAAQEEHEAWLAEEEAHAAQGGDN